MVKVLVLGARPEVAKFFFGDRLGGLNNTFFGLGGILFIISPTMMMCCVGICCLVSMCTFVWREKT